jgi:1,4-dihydroxy-6-naphthoate synthase
MSASGTRVFTLGHSPDPDDAFMFYAMAEHKIDLRGYQFEHRLEDIQTLNERALRGELDISAISIHAYAYVSGRYALLSGRWLRPAIGGDGSECTRRRFA